MPDRCLPAEREAGSGPGFFSDDALNMTAYSLGDIVLPVSIHRPIRLEEAPAVVASSRLVRQQTTRDDGHRVGASRVGVLSEHVLTRAF